MDMLAWIWFALIISFVVIEGITEQFVSIWFAIGSVGGLISNLAGASTIVQWIVFVVVSIISLICTRPFVKKFINRDKVKTNADRYLGEEGVVIQEIDNQDSKGQVKVLGSIWTARSIDDTNISKGELVEVDRIEGVKLLVHKKEN